MRLVLALACVVACKTANRPVDAPGTTGNSITYDFNGTSYSGSTLGTATLISSGAGGNDLGLQATDADGHKLVIAVEPATGSDKIAAGTFATNATAPLSTFQFTNGSDGTFAAGGHVGGSGSVTITVLTDTEIEGTFQATLVGSGSAQSSATIANGVFSLPLN
jgi:hypothetical protein